MTRAPLLRAALALLLAAALGTLPSCSRSSSRLNGHHGEHHEEAVPMHHVPHLHP